MVTSASGGAGGVAAPASRVKAARDATTTRRTRRRRDRGRGRRGAIADDGESRRGRSARISPALPRADQARRRRAAAPPPRTPRRTPPAWRARGRSRRIDCRRTGADLGSGSGQCGSRFRRRSVRISRRPVIQPETYRASANVALQRTGGPGSAGSRPRAERGGNRARGREGRRAAPLDRARKGQLPVRRPPCRASAEPRPARAAGGNLRPGTAGAGTSRRHPAARAGWWSRRFGSGE